MLWKHFLSVDLRNTEEVYDDLFAVTIGVEMVGIHASQHEKGEKSDQETRSHDMSSA